MSSSNYDLAELAEKVAKMAEKAAETLKPEVEKLDEQVTRLRTAHLNLKELYGDK